MGFEIDPDYVEVSQRIDDLYEKYPNATLEGDYVSVAFGANAYIVYTAKCWRHPDDPRPSIGIAMEEIPGKTPFTKGSEIQNAETSAWGRAIVASGASRSKKIASADEVRLSRARAEVQEPPLPSVAPLEQVDRIRAAVLELEIEGWVKDQQFGWPWSTEEAAAIEAKISSERTLINAHAATVPLADPKYTCPDCAMVGGGHTEDCPGPF